MWFKEVVVVGYLLTLIYCSRGEDGINNKTFPTDFLFGVVTAAYQIEGGWNEDGKGESIWDNYTHAHPDYITGQVNGDVASDSYHKYKEDVEHMKYLGLNHYRFSISWTRILPDGTPNNINQAGVTYYKNLIKELKDNDIIPLVTLYHWDLPETLQDAGGWPNEFIINKFADYARVCFQLFGDEVKFWVTINEPKQVCLQGYGLGGMAPGISNPGIEEYKCGHNVLKAHAAAWHIYDEEFRPTQNGKISIVIDSGFYQAATDSRADAVAAETALQFQFGWFANPVFFGDYPDIMKSRIAQRSAREGFNQTRLPTFTAREKVYIKGTHDFIGLNHYSSGLVEAIPEPAIGSPDFDSDVGVNVYSLPDWESSATSWLKITPWGMRGILNWIKDTYNNPDVIITENGISDNGTSLNDEVRISYYKRYLSNVRDAIDDGVNVFGYTVWSLMDTFEWRAGYSERYGMYFVDFNDPNRTRTPKSSVEYFKKVIETRCLVDICV